MTLGRVYPRRDISHGGNVMGKVTLGMASSHAFTLIPPSEWDKGRLGNRKGYERRYQVLPPEQPGVRQEAKDGVEQRYTHIRDALDTLRAKLSEDRPEALVMIADDQNENLTETNLPQIAIYVGDHFIAGREGANTSDRRSHPALAEAILKTCVEADIDMACIRKLPDDRLFAHAFGPVLDVVDPEANI